MRRAAFRSVAQLRTSSISACTASVLVFNGGFQTQLRYFSNAATSQRQGQQHESDADLFGEIDDEPLGRTASSASFRSSSSSPHQRPLRDPAEVVEDFHPFVLKKLLGIDSDRPDDVLDDVTDFKLSTRMSKPFEAALRHFKVEDKATNYRAASNAFLRAREILKDVWRPFPGDYHRVLSLIPYARTATRLAIYDAMLEDYTPNAEADAKRGYAVPGGGCPKRQASLIRKFEEKHVALLNARNSSAQPTYSGGPEAGIKPAFKMELDKTDIASVAFHAIRAGTTRQFDVCLELAELYFKLKATDTGPHRHKFHNRVINSFLVALCETKPTAEIPSILLNYPTVPPLTAATIVLRYNHDLGIELMAKVRSQQSDMRAVFDPYVMGAWSRSYLNEFPLMFRAVTGLFMTTAKEFTIESPQRCAISQHVYRALLCYDSSFRASTNSHTMRRGSVLSRASSVSRRHWFTTLGSLLGPERIASVFSSELMLIRDQPHPFGGTVFDGDFYSLAVSSQNANGYVIVDTNMAKEFVLNRSQFFNRISKHLLALEESGAITPKSAPTNLQAIFPFGVLNEMTFGAGRKKSELSRMTNAFTRNSSSLLAFRPNRDVAACAFTPLVHLYGAKNLGLVDRHIANIAFAMDTATRACRLRPVSAANSPSYQQQMESAVHEEEKEAEKAEQSQSQFSLSYFLDYVYMHVQRCLDVEVKQGTLKKSPMPPQHTVPNTCSYENNWLGTNAFEDKVNARVVVCSMDMELRAYLEAAGVIVFPPNASSAHSEEDGGDHEGDGALSGDGDDADDVISVAAEPSPSPDEDDVDGE